MVEPQLGEPSPRTEGDDTVEGLKSIDRLAADGDQSKYPDPRNNDPVPADEVGEAAATAGVNAAEKLLDAPRRGLFR